MDTLTSTATKVVSNTKLAIATLAMLGAGAVALATVPMTANSSYGWSGCLDGDNNEVVYGPINPFNAKQLFTKAVTAYNSGAKTDYCYTFPKTGKTYLMEGICNKGNFATWQKNCTELNLGKVGVNYQCIDGACVNKTATTTPNNTPCTETDGGENYYKKGETTGHWLCPEDGKPTVKEIDKCIDVNTLTEYVCNKGCSNILSIDIKCPNGCKDGACVNVTSTTQTTLTVTKNLTSPNQAVKGTDILLSKFDLTASSAEGIGINQIKFVVAPSSNLVQNWVLKADGIQLGKALPNNTADGYLMFPLSSNFVVPAGNKKTILLYGDTWNYSSVTTTGSLITGVYFINAFGLTSSNYVPVGNLPVWATNVVIK